MSPSPSSIESASGLTFALNGEAPGNAPQCGLECPKHDHRERTWRDLDLCGDQLFLHALVPRVECPEHGVNNRVGSLVGRVVRSSPRVSSGWRSRCSVEISVAGVARRLAISWDQVDAIMVRAVERGKLASPPAHRQTSWH